MFNDSHLHLDMITDNEIEAVLKNAKNAGVDKFVSCSTSFVSNSKNLELAKKFPQVKPAIGLYPLDLLELNELELDKAFYFFNAEISKAIAIGEVGLDFKYATKQAEQQKQCEVLARFIELANKNEKPLILHSRFAQRQVIETLKEHKAKKALLHSYTDSLKLMKRSAEEGYFVSVGLNILTNEQVAKNILHFPLENLLLETDSPIKSDGETIYPEKIVLVAKKVAEIKNISLKEVEEQTNKNFETLFYKK